MTMAHDTLDALLDANPVGKEQEKVIRETVRLLKRLRDAGMTSSGYNLRPPYGADKRLLRTRGGGKLPARSGSSK
jgi:hypothetical protein